MATSPLEAAAPWYEIEVLIFEHLAPGTRTSKTGLSDLSPLDFNRALRLPSPEAKTAVEESADLFPLSSRTWKLTDLEQRLHQSSRYRSLLHRSWSQSPASPQRARPVYLRFPPPEPSSRGETSPAANAEASPRGRIPFPSQYLRPELAGTIKLSQERFLHLSLDLRYWQPSEAALQELEEGIYQTPPSGSYFRLAESRRVRIQEIHYFDHPLFGVLVQIRQGNPPDADNPSSPKTFPLGATAVQEMLPEGNEAGEAITPEE